MEYLRSFNNDGVEFFRHCLNMIRSGEIELLPETLISDSKYSVQLLQLEKLPFPPFSSKLDFARQLHSIVEPLDIPDKFDNTGLWSWLAAYYFDILCPPSNSGRNIRKTNLYICEERIGERPIYYRHLVAFPVRAFDRYKDTIKVIYSSKIHQYGDTIETFASRGDVFRNESVMQVADILYWDQTNNIRKPGALSTDKDAPGVARRFVQIVQQFELTYDLYSMTPKQIVGILPDEFTLWLG